MSQQTDIQKLFYEACGSGDEEAVKRLIKTGAVVDAISTVGSTALHIASSLGKEKVVKCLIDAGANVNVKGEHMYTPLHSASGFHFPSEKQDNYEKIVSHLIDAKVDVDSIADNGDTALQLAIQNGHERIVVILIEAGANIKSKIKENGYTPLHLASLLGFTEIVSHLSRAGADAHDRANDGQTPISLATQLGHDSIVEILKKN